MKLKMISGIFVLLVGLVSQAYAISCDNIDRMNACNKCMQVSKNTLNSLNCQNLTPMQKSAISQNAFYADAAAYEQICEAASTSTYPVCPCPNSSHVTCNSK